MTDQNSYMEMAEALAETDASQQIIVKELVKMGADTDTAWKIASESLHLRNMGQLKKRINPFITKGLLWVIASYWLFGEVMVILIITSIVLRLWLSERKRKLLAKIVKAHFITQIFTGIVLIISVVFTTISVLGSLNGWTDVEFVTHLFWNGLGSIVFGIGFFTKLGNSFDTEQYEIPTNIKMYDVAEHLLGEQFNPHEKNIQELDRIIIISFLVTGVGLFILAFILSNYWLAP